MQGRAAAASLVPLAPGMPHLPSPLAGEGQLSRSTQMKG